METETDKNPPNTLLIILTLFDLVAAAGGAAPFAMAALISGTDAATGQSNFALIISVPAVAVVLVMVAWLFQVSGRRKAAFLTAAVPLIWGMTVLVMLNGPSV